ncbi:hypothetical protein LFT51_02095 [Mycobacterium intracellulare subsp. chimaera]|uniref:hypothetical protein n=1 Tax=Mycobacterium intracellulare TaxID=1767 RepID=UPI00044B2814|nr:hypothetical protein [Mycobacterium intracellulare]ASL18890.1 hypothetical protein MYCOZU1_00411 [Mycobacterium intracellulare subsp. chimaera]ETZ39462.1 hypothetical protein L842_5863 [Mycobacterium intracellulare MIN_052511_1280]ETZ40508.1 hypothetical protein L842_5678 [Mycobacterium intracellulare MIN_052511_1280]QGK46804.1 hypothetical protein GJE02_02065 [Mycobacterium intracellulare subsp. chimaera]UCN04451.1 hypothetical protein LFT51_02095 [Mycobacterium intracellulare subsp. chima
MTVPGLDPTSSYSRHLAARFLDFTSPKTPWARRLWDLGSFLALEELHDVGEWLDRQVLSPRAVKWLQHDLEKQLGQDAAFGTRELSQQLTRCVKSDLTIRSDGRRRLRQIIDLARPGYLDRWAAEAARAEPPRAERVARAAATHLLDSGHSLPGLHRWLAERSTLSAVDLLTEAASLAALSPKQFRIWVPVISLPKPERLADPLPNFTRRSDLDPETAEQLQPTSTKPLLGAFSYDIEARDAEWRVPDIESTRL